MKITIPSVEAFIAEAPFEEVRLGVFTRHSSATSGETSLPTLAYEIFLTGARDDKLFEYSDYLGFGLTMFKEELEKLHKSAFELRDRIQQELERVGIQAKEGKIESL